MVLKPASATPYSALALAELAPGSELEHDRGAGGEVVAHEDRFLAFRQMDPHRLDPVDLLDRQHQFVLARGAQAFALQRAAGAQRQTVERSGGIGAGQRAILRHQHPRAVEIVLGDGQGAGRIVDLVGDPRLVEAGHHAGAFAVVQFGIEDALRGGAQHRPGQRDRAKRRSAEEPRQGALYERLARQRAQTLERGARAQRRKRRFGRGYKLAHLITLPSA